MYPPEHFAAQPELLQHQGIFSNNEALRPSDVYRMDSGAYPRSLIEWHGFEEGVPRPFRQEAIPYFHGSAPREHFFQTQT